MNIHPQSAEAYQLFHLGTLAMADVEANGICVDVPYCEEQYKILGKRIKTLKEDLDKEADVKRWKHKFGTKFNIDSDDQLGYMLFDYFKCNPINTTKSGKPSVDNETLNVLKDEHPFLEILINLRKIQKVRDTYLSLFLREQVDGFLHPFFDLTLVHTYRSSSRSPNWQNLPVRDPVQGKVVRKAIRPRKGHRLMGIDYSGIEVRAASWYHKDPTMLSYIHDKTKDMHRDMACELYCLSLKEVNSKSRYSAKNGFVFPEFYGSYYKQTANDLWKNIDKLKLVNEVTQESLKKHLKKKGILNYPAYERHVQRVEDNFWKKRFPVYTQWKDKQVDFYNEHGYVDLLTGFRCSGVMRKNQVINYPVQGIAFHCLLWSLIQVNDVLKREKWRTRIVGQIHDEMVADVYEPECSEFIDLVQRVMCYSIRRHWNWIITPLEVEIKSTEVDGTWDEKKELKLTA